MYNEISSTDFFFVYQVEDEGHLISAFLLT